MSQDERRAVSVAAITGAARRRFAASGFAATSIDDIAADAAVAKGGLYHHFATKVQLFEAVFREVEDDLYTDVVTGLPDTRSGADLLVAGSWRFMACCIAPDVHRIVLVDGPAVLGWSRWRQIDADHFLPFVVRALQLDAGPDVDVTPIAQLLIGAVDEAAMLLADARDPAATLAELADGLETVLRAVAGAVAHR